MKKYILNLSLRNKVLASASAALFSLLVLGFSYFNTVSQLETNEAEILKIEGVGKDALRMKFAMAHSLKLLMEVITTDNQKDVEMFYNEHLDVVKLYEQTYSSLDTALSDKSWGVEYETEKVKLLNTAATFDKFHDERLQATLAKVHELRLKELAGDTSASIDAEINSLDDALDAEAEGVLANVNEFVNSIDTLSTKIQNDSNEHAIAAKIQGVVLIILGILLTLVAFYFFINYLIEGIKKLTGAVNQLSEGKLPETIVNDAKDELGTITGALNVLTSGLHTTSKFANEIGSGNFEIDYKPLSDEDVLGDSLLKMRNNLKLVAEEDKKRNWSTQGLAKFADILRSNSNSIEELSNDIISSLVKYLGANQGSLFIVNDTNPKDVHLEMLACYAWDKKKHIDKKIEQGEGLVGQAWLEADVILLTEIPEHFVEITSGLGGATPNSIIIVPLTVNEVTYGVIEIASFNQFEEYQVDFLKKLAESIASTLSGAKTNERTKILLEQSQMQAEQMRAQEEEMRQNMEEMQATSEEAERKALNYESAIARLNEEVRALTKENEKLKQK